MAEANTIPRVGQHPRLRHSPMLPTLPPTTALSSHSSARSGMVAEASSSARAGGLRRAARACTASRTVRGTSSVSAASASVTKSDCPPSARKARPRRRPSAQPWRPPPRREGAELKARDGPVARQLTQDDPQWVRGAELLVAVARDEHCRGFLDAPRDEPGHVKGRLIGPVNVLQHQHGGGGCLELAEERVGDVVGLVAALDGLSSCPR